MCKIYAIYAVLLLNLLFTLFCREIYFATIYTLSCGEKLSPKVHLWRKNDKYQVCQHCASAIISSGLCIAKVIIINLTMMMIILDNHFRQAALSWLRSLASCVCAFTPSISVEGNRHLIDIAITTAMKAPVKRC